jgi:hypothetical protein
MNRLIPKMQTTIEGGAVGRGEDCLTVNIANHLWRDLLPGGQRMLVIAVRAQVLRKNMTRVSLTYII